MEKQKFIQTKRGIVMIAVWVIIAVWTITLFSSCAKKRNEFLEYKDVQQDLVTVILSIDKDRYASYAFMSEEMVDRMFSAFQKTSYRIPSSTNNGMGSIVNGALDNVNEDIDKDTKKVTELMQEKGYTNFDSNYDITSYLQYYNFWEYEHYDHFYKFIGAASVVVVTIIANAILVYFQRRSKKA